MSRVQIAGGLLGGCLLFCLIQPAPAQAPFSPYLSRPTPVPLSRPTLSPYFHLFRTDTGPLGNYLSYVRPRLQLQQTLRSQAAQIQRQESSLRTLGQQVYQLQRPATMRPTGAGSTFMNYSHYYSGVGSRPGAAPRRETIRPTRSGSFSARSYSGSFSVW